MIGLELSARYFAQVVEPLIAAAMPDLHYGAARLGNGSEVLGYDTEMSADHNYGPMLQIYLGEADFSRAPELMAALDSGLPERFGDWLVRFPAFGRPVGRPHWLTSNHGVEIMTLEAMVKVQIGVGLDPPAPLEWLAMSEQALLTLVKGAVFRDDHGMLARTRQQLDYFSRDVWLLKLAAQWDRVGEERAFVGRTGDLGDDLGSRVIAARLARDLMRIGFLIERQYAPYAKWFGTAFQNLDCAPQVGAALRQALSAEDWQLREGQLAHAAKALGELQLERQVPGAIPPVVESYFTRPFQVINAPEIAAGLRAQISDDMVRTMPAGAIDQFSDSTAILTDAMMTQDLLKVTRDHRNRSG